MGSNCDNRIESLLGKSFYNLHHNLTILGQQYPKIDERVRRELKNEELSI